MHFIPNPANTEFIYLVGLEECVSRILNLDTSSPPMPVPFTCSQCQTDFTPTWKWDKTAKGEDINSLCSTCNGRLIHYGTDMKTRTSFCCGYVIESAQDKGSMKLCLTGRVILRLSCFFYQALTLSYTLRHICSDFGGYLAEKNY